MTRVNCWIASLLAIALSAVVGTQNVVVAQTNTGTSDETKQEAKQEAKQSDQSSSTASSSSGQAGQSQPSPSGSATSSGSAQSGSSNSQPSASSSQSGNSQPNNAQSSGNSSSNRSQNQGQPNQPSTSGQSNRDQNSASGQQSSDNQARDSQNAQNQQQARDNQNRDSQSRDNQNRGDNNRNNTNVNIGVGIQFGNVTDRGIVVTNVQQSSFFYTSGIRQGDVIVSVSGRPIRNHDEFIQFISVRRGERIPVIILRDGRQETIYVVYEESPNFQANVGNAQGAVLLGVTFDTQVQNAVVIATVQPGGPAAQIGLKPGDHIVSINGRKLSGFQNAIQVVSTMRPGDQVDIEFLQLQRSQIVLNTPGNVQASGSVGVGQNTYQSNYPPNGQVQAGGQVQVNQGQVNPNDPNMNRTQQQNRNSNQPNNQNRSLIPRIRN